MIKWEKPKTNQGSNMREDTSIIPDTRRVHNQQFEEESIVEGPKYF
jgi:hypothetical protein